MFKTCWFYRGSGFDRVFLVSNAEQQPAHERTASMAISFRRLADDSLRRAYSTRSRPECGKRNQKSAGQRAAEEISSVPIGNILQPTKPKNKSFTDRVCVDVSLNRPQDLGGLLSRKPIFAKTLASAAPLGKIPTYKTHCSRSETGDT